MSSIRRCSSKGKSIAISSSSTDSESLGSLLVRKPRAITLGGTYSPRLPTEADLAELNDQERSVVHFGVDFRLADFLPMRWTGTDFEFAEEIDPEKVRRFSVKKNQKWENHLPTWSSLKSVRRLVLQTDPPAGPWMLPFGYACVYESWFNNCRLWWPLPELMTTYCSRGKIALNQYTKNKIRIMVALMVLVSELDITMSVHLFEELTTPSITVKTGFFYGKMVLKYNMITGKPSKVNHWNQPYFYVRINEASIEDPSVILNGYFTANIAIRTLSHQHWPDISETRIQTALNRIGRGTPQAGQEGPSSGKKFTKRRKISHSEEGASNGSSPPAPQDDEVVEYPHLVDFHYHHTEIPFVRDHEAQARLVRQIKLRLKFFGFVNLMVVDYEAKIQAQKEKLMEKSKSLKNKNKKKKENAELKGKWDMYEDKVGQIEMEQEKVEADSKFETTTKMLRESWEHEVWKERLRVEAAMKQQVMPVYGKMRQYLDEQPAIQGKLVLCSQAKGGREGLQKIQDLGMSINEVLEQVRIDEARYSDELNAMEITDSCEINLDPPGLGLDEHGFNLPIFSPQDVKDLRHSD
ncbi:hypothetical protein N665_0026s0053 [Sinapis alba]|nr:hypothetical protein N665_0026s0053 [Sinapis alba]